MRPALEGFARREWGPLFGTVRAALRDRGWRAVALTLGAVCLTSLFQLVQNQPWGYGPVQAVGSVRAEDPLWQALLRTPLSLFVPALDLPVWGALAQVLVVFGIAEVCLGRARTLLIAYTATLAGTTYARVGIALGPDAPLGLGLPASDARVVDTGPSAAVVGLAVFVCWRYRARLTGWLVIAAMVVEVVVKPNLAGKEHLVAIAVVVAGYGVVLWRQRRSPSPVTRRPPSPVPRPSPSPPLVPGPSPSRVTDGSRSGKPATTSWNLRASRTQRRS
ncbi:hypothetical protein NRO40_07475 [Streptomyces changanensis]|uniref:Integral membrane protein n=1 Tax=Streptomyces changanensis TaxID=2964669 RepID=A0ABY5N3C1_9ACTN|nr:MULTISPECIES: hypothetical protein [Streptomyces]UUS30688.1 hypothetical protein NRO40_07475 [Streptomyces changanensis]